MKRRFQEADVFSTGRGAGNDNLFSRPRLRGTGFTDQELESRFGATGEGGGTSSPSHVSVNAESSTPLMDEETVRRMLAAERRGHQTVNADVNVSAVAHESTASTASAAPVAAFAADVNVIPEQAVPNGQHWEPPVVTPPPDFGHSGTTATPTAAPQSLGPSTAVPATSSTPTPPSMAAPVFNFGDIVMVKGLKAAAYLNGQHGKLGRFDVSTGRWEVILADTGEAKAVKPENLDLVRSQRGSRHSEDVTAEELFVPPPSPETQHSASGSASGNAAPAVASASPRGSSGGSVGTGLGGSPGGVEGDTPVTQPSPGSGRAGGGSGVAGLSSASLVGSAGSLHNSRSSTGASGSTRRTTTRRQGTVRWYNGRRKIGKVIPDGGGSDLFIPAQGALNGSQVPPQPGGLFHGTRVSFMPVALAASGGEEASAFGGNKAAAKTGETVCMDVRALPGQVGLSCGVDTNAGAKERNDDRLAACDLHELGFFAGVFDGHRGFNCAEHVSKNLAAGVLTAYRARAKREGNVGKMSSSQECSLISSSLVDAFEATDKAFLVTAKKKDIHDGSTAVVGLVCHGFEAPVPTAPVVLPGGGAASLWAKVAKKLGTQEEELEEPTIGAGMQERAPGTVLSAVGGVAKLFVAWCGDSRAILIRGRKGLRCSEDHRPSRKDETARIQRAGGTSVKDAHGVWRVGPREQSRFAKELQKGRKNEKAMRFFLSTSRSFGDAELKAPDPIISCTPDVKVVDLTPEDWAVVLASDGVTDALTDQQVANVMWKTMSQQGKDPVAAAKALVQAALSNGSRDNCTAVVMRLGWAPAPRSDDSGAASTVSGTGASVGTASAAAGQFAGGSANASAVAAHTEGRSDFDIFG
eukprot:TRINITY_DN40274_c0_g1_i1.p1 TRINITY_DN40274_c0_g1~~TRINITY_DN40274_c0_g1_i1.p1  ORF type:complete len:865 (+),score=168.48 TRINITY_DN40274_c0_g1_i1:342-2936(+)